MRARGSYTFPSACASPRSSAQLRMLIAELFPSCRRPRVIPVHLQRPAFPLPLVLAFDYDGPSTKRFMLGYGDIALKSARFADVYGDREGDGMCHCSVDCGDAYLSAAAGSSVEDRRLSSRLAGRRSVVVFGYGKLLLTVYLYLF